MKPKDLTGSVIDRFTYDTPDQAQADFYALCEADTPLILVFLPNFGHPISRVYLTRYMDSLDSLTSGRLACVVRSDPQNIAAKLDAPFPFPLICDAAGALYEYFQVQTTGSRLAWSFPAMRIFREAKKMGYQPEKRARQQLPLTLVVGREGKILFSHYGESLTDLPEDCAAMERVCSRLIPCPAEKPVEMPAADAVQPDQAPEETAAPAQDAPDLAAAGSMVFFPGEEAVLQPEEPAEQDTDRTQPIDLTGWTAPADEAEETPEPTEPEDVAPEETQEEVPEETEADPQEDVEPEAEPDTAPQEDTAPEAEAEPSPAEPAVEAAAAEPADAPAQKVEEETSPAGPRWAKLVDLFAERMEADRKKEE